jgi:hypothetical protein
VVGTVFCLHHDDEDPVGSDPVPCPFCGHGTDEPSPVTGDEIEALGIEDSSAALRHALADDGAAERSESMTGDTVHGRYR